MTNETKRNLCNARNISVTNIMQTRLPSEIGIGEVERVCRLLVDPSKFDCLIVHLVRDPRAVLSSLIPMSFFEGEVSSLRSPCLLKEYQILCSLVLENLENSE